MKKYLFMCTIGIILLNGLVSGDVSAQSLKPIKVEVKFDFRVGDKVYPAGVYRLESVSPGSDNVLQLRGTEKENSQLIIANLSYAGKRQSPKLVFRQIGEEYYLTKVFLTDGNWGFSIRPSRGQTENAKKLASIKTVEVLPKN